MPILLSLLLLLPQQRLILPDLMDGVLRTYGKLNDFSADFEQISTNPSNQKQVERGHLYLAKTGKKMRFDYLVPVAKSYYSDGKTFTEFTPGLKQAVQTPVSKANDERLQVFQVFVGNREWKDQYPNMDEPKGQELIAGNRVVRLYPRRKDLPNVLLEIDPRTFLIHRFELEYTDSGEKNQFVFKNLRTNGVDPSVFVFNRNNFPGVDVIETK